MYIPNYRRVELINGEGTDERRGGRRKRRRRDMKVDSGEAEGWGGLGNRGREGRARWCNGFVLILVHLVVLSISEADVS